MKIAPKNRVQRALVAGAAALALLGTAGCSAINEQATTFSYAASDGVVLEVTDNGSGMVNPESDGTEGFGISNMRARAEKLGARLEVRTAAGRGSSIVVHLPMN